MKSCVEHDLEQVIIKKVNENKTKISKNKLKQNKYKINKLIHFTKAQIFKDKILTNCIRIIFFQLVCSKKMEHPQSMQVYTVWYILLLK